MKVRDRRVRLPGVAYDESTGLLNLVGSESQTACDGAICFGPFDFFATGGDLRLMEAPPTPLPAVTPVGLVVLSLLLAAVAIRAALASRRTARVRYAALPDCLRPSRMVPRWE